MNLDLVKEYNKVVPDKIPEIINKRGNICKYSMLNDEKFLGYLEEKLAEEVEEYLETKDIEELGDLIEIIQRILVLRSIPQEELQAIINEKKETKGGFERNILLIHVED